MICPRHSDCCLHPEELDPEISGAFEMVDTETGAHRNFDVPPAALAGYRQHLRTWTGAVELACVEQRVFYAQVSTGWSLDGETIPQLRKIGLLELT